VIQLERKQETKNNKKPKIKSAYKNSNGCMKETQEVATNMIDL
jgi:hypothetical protein